MNSIIDAHIHFHRTLDYISVESIRYMLEWEPIAMERGVETVNVILTHHYLEDFTKTFRDSEFFVPVLYLGVWDFNNTENLTEKTQLAQKHGIDTIKLTSVPFLKNNIDDLYSQGFRKFHLHSERKELIGLLDHIKKYENACFHLAHGAFNAGEQGAVSKHIMQDYLNAFKDRNTMVNFGTSPPEYTYFPDDLQRRVSKAIELGLEDHVAFESDLNIGFFLNGNADTWFDDLRDTVNQVTPEATKDKVFYKNARRFLDYRT